MHWTFFTVPRNGAASAREARAVRKETGTATADTRGDGAATGERLSAKRCSPYSVTSHSILWSVVLLSSDCRTCAMGSRPSPR